MTARTLAIESVRSTLRSRWTVWPGTPRAGSKCNSCAKGSRAIVTVSRGDLCTRVIFRLCLKCAQHEAAHGVQS